MKISNNALRIFATEAVIAPDAENALDRTALLVGPILATYSERIITPQSLQEILENELGWKIQINVSESLLGQLAKRSFLTRHIHNDEISFVVETTKPLNESNNTIELLIIDFKEFVEDKTLLPKLSDSEIIDLFLTKIFEVIDLAHSEDVNTPNYNPEDNWKHALVSDYVLRKTEITGSLPPLLKRLAELCLLREVVENYTSSSRTPAPTQLRVLLDSPIALSLIGAGGPAIKQSTKILVDTASSIGVCFSVLPPTINEMARNLSAVLNTDPRDRHGQTGSALRRGEVSQHKVLDMKTNPEKYLRHVGVDTLNKNLSMFPNEHRFFPKEAVSEFEGMVKWVDGEAAIEHDADLLAITVRSRGGKNERNILRNKFVAVTENEAFVRISRDFCLDHFYINDTHSPPVINIRSFAASIWLEVGFEAGESIPQNVLLANCEKILARNSKIFEKATSLLEEFSKDSEEDLSLLLQDRNCVDALISETYNNPKFIDNQDVAYLVDKIKKSVAADVRAEERAKAGILHQKREEEAEKERLNYEKKIYETEKNASEEIQKHKEVLERITSDIDRDRISRRQQIQTRIDGINNKFEDGIGIFEYIEVLLFVVASILLALTGEVWAFWAGIFLLVFTFLFSLAAYKGFSFPGKLKQSAYRRYARNLLKREFSRVEMERWGISEQDGKIVWGAKSVEEKDRNPSGH